MSVESDFENSWDSKFRAESYARLEFPNTYYLAYRDLPEILRRHVSGRDAIDFGCGTGRSTRFLKQLGFNATGIDISGEMLKIALSLDQGGNYMLVENGKYSHLGEGNYDLVQAIFTFDNIPGWENRTNILVALKKLLKPGGKLILLDSTPEIYVNEWASFSTKNFRTNFNAVTGDKVFTTMLDVEDKSPVEDIFWSLPDYYRLFELAGLKETAFYKPLGNKEEPFKWVTETTVAPWMIFVLGKL